MGSAGPAPSRARGEETAPPARVRMAARNELAFATFIACSFLGDAGRLAARKRPLESGDCQGSCAGNAIDEPFNWRRNSAHENRMGWGDEKNSPAGRPPQAKCRL